jgi:hypothetical protein
MGDFLDAMWETVDAIVDQIFIYFKCSFLIYEITSESTGKLLSLFVIKKT